MPDKQKELEEVIADLEIIKEAVGKSDSFFRFVDTRGAMKNVLLCSGFIFLLIAGGFYFLIDHYGSFQAIPLSVRSIIFTGIGIAWLFVGFIKLRNFLLSGRSFKKDLNLARLFDEIYTSWLIAMMLPFFGVTIFLAIFLIQQGLYIYLTPTLAILFGFIFIAMHPILNVAEFYFISIWLIATGLLTLFMVELFHPMVALGLTFSAGFVLGGLLLHLDLTGMRHKRCR